MIADQPFVSYKKDKNKKPTKSAMDNFADEWAEKHKNSEGKKISMSDFLRNDNVIKK